MARVAVVMRTKDSAWVVDQALAGLFAQRFRDFELLVVDSGSRDATLEVVGRYPCRLERIAPKAYFPGSVLNDAIRRTDAEIIVFQNSDVVPLSPHALERVLAPLSDPAVVASFARQVPRPEADAWVRRDYDVAFPATGDAPEWMALSLPFAAIRRSAWEAHPFYEDAWASEDTEWGRWAKRAGHAIRYVPDAVVMHSHNYTLRQIYGRRFVEGEADAFIERTPASLLRALRAFAASVVHDLRRGDFTSPVRRAVYHWAYVAGRRLGERRLAEGDRDRAKGQAVVLARYG